MNFSSSPAKPKILLGENSGFGITWRGYLTRATLIALGLGGYVLFRKNLDLTGNAKRCFYALRKYFPRVKDDEDGDKDQRRCAAIGGYDSETCPVCLGNSKNGVRASCGHFLCTKCLARYCEISRTNSPPCPLCRKPLNSVSLLRISADITETLLVANPEVENLNPIIINDCGNERTVEVSENIDEDHEPDPDPESGANYLFAINWRDDRKYLQNLITWSLLLVVLMVPWCEFIGYESIFDFLMRLLVVMPTIYIWFMYRDRTVCRFVTVPPE